MGLEKKYNSRFEKLDESVGEIKSHLSEMREAKKAKAEAKAREIEEKKQLLESKTVEPSEPIKVTEIVQPVKYDPVHQKPITQPTQPTQSQTQQQQYVQPQVTKLPDYKKMFKRKF